MEGNNRRENEYAFWAIQMNVSFEDVFKMAG